ncbi:MAG TPA: DEAD/DEAH box helicase family protein [Candidatus Competibacteraceae bacterium]|nr:DEAD/DEAH box helicase family protein [Candidatus Competibacteraceae bacterium]HSA47896.1 DEAD/DEAH box helicase family protein [Candidatus Competibacteraceae bacterium]
MRQLRPWQQKVLVKALHWLLEDRQDRRFLINAAPGAGKTLVSCVMAQALIERQEIDRVIVIAPRAEVVNQWADDFRRVTGRYMSKVTARDGDIHSLGLDVCATWSAIQGLQDALQAMCRSARVLVICDEHHHAAVQAAWGEGADSAFTDARFALILTGTPIRSDGAESVWLPYDDVGAIDHPADGTYTLTYGQAVDLGYCRPVTFHRHEGRFTVDLEDGQAIQISGQQPAILPKPLARIAGLQRALDFYRLACTPQYAVDNRTPLATEKLDDLRLRLPNAGGLVIAPTIGMAEYLARLIEHLDGEAPVLVHSQMPNPEGKIKAFKSTDKRWLVSVAMVSEGVDIPRLRVLVYLPNALTELAFRQAIGRVVRTYGPDDDTRAYVVMPSFETFERYARRVEEEMPTSIRTGQSIQAKRCPACGGECALGAALCLSCGHEFPVVAPRVKPCSACGALNPKNAATCQTCGAAFVTSFTLTLDEALRTGAIVRGMDLDETEVRESENLAPYIRSQILQSGDEKLVRILKTLPDESWTRLRDILL